MTIEQLNEFYKSLRGVDLSEEQIQLWNAFIVTEDYTRILNAYDGNEIDTAFHFMITRNYTPYTN